MPDIVTDHSQYPPPRREVYAVTERWREVARMVVLGVKSNEIAATLNITPASVSGILRQPATVQYIEELRASRDDSTADVHERIVACADNAVDFLERAVKGKADISPSLQMKAALAILDRAGYPAATKNINVGLQPHLSAADIEEMRQRALSSGSLAPSTTEGSDGARGVETCDGARDTVPCDAAAHDVAPEPENA